MDFPVGNGLAEDTMVTYELVWLVHFAHEAVVLLYHGSDSDSIINHLCPSDTLDPAANSAF